MSNISLILLIIIMGVFAPSLTNIANAQYLGNVGKEGETGAGTLEENLEFAKRKVIAAEANPASGSGTPYLDANGVVGASIIAGAIFGGIATAFVRSRSCRYAAMGRG